MNPSMLTIRAPFRNIVVAGVIFGIGALSAAPAQAVPMHVLTNPGFTGPGQAGANASPVLSKPAPAGTGLKNSNVFPPADPQMNGTNATEKADNALKHETKGSNVPSIVELAVSGSLTPTADNGEQHTQVLSNEADPQVVPIPAALPMLAAAVAGLGFAGWRRKRAAA